MTARTENVTVNVMDVPLTPHPLWPYVAALVAAIGFGLPRFRARRGWAIWAIGGAVLGLVVATIASGLADAAATPYIRTIRTTHQLVAVLITVVTVGLAGWLLNRASSRRRSDSPTP